MLGIFKESFLLFCWGDMLIIVFIKILGDDCICDFRFFLFIVGFRGVFFLELILEKDFLDGMKGGLYCWELKFLKGDGGEVGGEENVWGE